MKVIFKASLDRNGTPSERVRVVRHKSGKYAITSFTGEVAHDYIKSENGQALIMLAQQRVANWIY